MSLTTAVFIVGAFVVAAACFGFWSVANGVAELRVALSVVCESIDTTAKAVRSSTDSLRFTPRILPAKEGTRVAYMLDTDTDVELSYEAPVLAFLERGGDFSWETPGWKPLVLLDGQVQVSDKYPFESIVLLPDESSTLTDALKLRSKESFLEVAKSFLKNVVAWPVKVEVLKDKAADLNWATVCAAADALGVVKGPDDVWHMPGAGENRLCLCGHSLNEHSGKDFATSVKGKQCTRAGCGCLEFKADSQKQDLI
jgi:hypothetical protein